LNFQQLLELDAHLSAKMRVAERPGFIRSVAIFLAHSGDSWFWWGALGLLWWLGNLYWQSWAKTILLSIIGLAVLVLSIKFLVRRQRPAGEWGGFYRKTDPHSFPSGHASRAILIAVLVSGFGPLWLIPVIWLWALLVCLARVAMGVHYISDIAAGMLTGLLAGLGILFVKNG
jgi:undecaprenyl-diphosphatase